MAAAVVGALALLVGVGASAASTTGAAGPAQAGGKESVIFFAADGLRRDLVESYAANGAMPAMAKLLRSGAKAAGGGLLTQSPPNTGAGWYSLATGAWPGVHGSTNNTFHVNGQAFANRTGSSTRASSRPRPSPRPPSAAARRSPRSVGRRRVGVIDGPTVDFRGFFSGRGVATNYIAPTDDPAFPASFGLQFDHPAGFAGQARFAGAAPTRDRLDGAPQSFSQAQEMRMRVLDFGADKYGLNAYIFDSTNDNTVNYNRVLFSPTKNAADGVATLGRGQWGDVKVKIVGGALNGLTAGMLIKVEELNASLSRARLFHTSVTRANASWVGWSEPGFTGDFAEYVAQEFPTSTAADFAVLEAGIVRGAYVEQGLYWSTGHHPLIEYILEKTS